MVKAFNDNWTEDMSLPGHVPTSAAMSPRSQPANEAQLRAQFEEHKKACPSSKLTFEQFKEVLAFENESTPLCFPRLAEGKLEFSY